MTTLKNKVDADRLFATGDMNQEDKERWTAYRQLEARLCKMFGEYVEVVYPRFEVYNVLGRIMAMAHNLEFRIPPLGVEVRMEPTKHKMGGTVIYRIVAVDQQDESIEITRPADFDKVAGYRR